MTSPWEAVLGDRIESLHPRLRAYFGEITEGNAGIGVGVFAVVGTPRRWLWPIFWVLGRDGVLFPGWEHDVPFTVRNTPRGSTLHSSRIFRFPRGDREMVDVTSSVGDVVEDRLGHRGLVRARLAASVVDGSLTLASTRTWLAGIPLPRWIAPRVSLTERWDATANAQRVSFVLEAPLLGRLYEYAGSFTYRIVEAGS